MKTRIFWVVAWVLSFVACAPRVQAQVTLSQQQSTAMFKNSAQFIPDVQFERWYNEVLTACHRAGDCLTTPRAKFVDIIWYKYNGLIPCGPDQQCDGQAIIDVNLIFLSPRAMIDQRVIKHEILHLILGTADHPQVFTFLNLGRE